MNRFNQWRNQSYWHRRRYRIGFLDVTRFLLYAAMTDAALIAVYFAVTK